MVTSDFREILFVNAYFQEEFTWGAETLQGQPVARILTKASSILLDSYIVPLLLDVGHCEEIRITLQCGNGERRAVAANVRCREDRQFWMITSATSSEEVYNEQIRSKQALARRADAFQSLSATDALTGLLNRRELDRQIRLAARAAKATGEAMAVLLLDVDLFKRINDSHGHAAGDAVLEALGKVLKQAGRNADIIGRFGGEEFLLILPGSDAPGAANFAERLHQRIRKLKIDEVTITVSIGHVQYDAARDVDITSLLKRADEALYAAKESGRNCTVSEP